jgi:type I restriction enzyme S subunit
VISGRKVYPIVVGLPPLNEQKLIATKVNRLFHLCDELEAELAHSQRASEHLMEAVVREVVGG